MDKRNKTLIAGVHSCIEALDEGTNLDKILVKKGASGENMGKLLSKAKEAGVSVQHVPLEKLDRMTGLNHQGVVALMSLIPYHDLDETLTSIIEEGRKPFGLLLDGVTDVRNFGAIARTAECFGVDFIVVPQQGSARINSEAIRTSSGALHSIPVCRVHHLMDAVYILQAADVQVVAANEKSSHSIAEGKWDKGVAVVMGSEDKGVSTSILKRSDRVFHIPMSGKISSLNVSVAAGIFLYTVSIGRS